MSPTDTRKQLLDITQCPQWFDERGYCIFLICLYYNQDNTEYTIRERITIPREIYKIWWEWITPYYQEDMDNWEIEWLMMNGLFVEKITSEDMLHWYYLEKREQTRSFLKWLWITISDDNINIHEYSESWPKDPFDWKDQIQEYSIILSLSIYESWVNRYLDTKEKHHGNNISTWIMKLIDDWILINYEYSVLPELFRQYEQQYNLHKTTRNWFLDGFTQWLFKNEIKYWNGKFNNSKNIELNYDKGEIYFYSKINIRWKEKELFEMLYSDWRFLEKSKNDICEILYSEAKLKKSENNLRSLARNVNEKLRKIWSNYIITTENGIYFITDTYKKNNKS